MPVRIPAWQARRPLYGTLDNAHHLRRTTLVVSPDILAEYAEVLHRPRFKLGSGHISRVLSVIEETSKLVKPARRVSISRDEPDNRFYECAEAGKADFLITGNTRHFPLHHKGARVVTPREFNELIAEDIAGRNR